MCDSPIHIKNLNRIKDRKIADRLKARFPWKDYTSAYIDVPCGHCRSCIRAKQDALVQRVQFESTKNHLFMATLTYSPKMLPHYMINGYNICYADVTDVQKCIKMLRKDNAFGIPFRTLCVSELGSKRGRPHFHILFLFPKSYFPDDKEAYIAECDSFASKSRHYFTLLNYWRRNYGSRRIPDWHNLTDYKEKWINGKLNKNYDFHYINPFLTTNGVEDCGMYVLKYMFKPSDRAVKLQQALRLNLSEADFDKVWRIVKPRTFKCIGFGYNAEVQLRQKVFNRDPDIINKLKEDVRISRDNLNYPSHFHPFTGKQQLIAPYYLNNPQIYSEYDRFHFWMKQGTSAPGVPQSLKTHQIKSFTDNRLNQIRYEKTQDHVDAIGVDCNFDLLD